MRRLSSTHWKAAERSRSPYYRLAEKEFKKALMRQLSPVIEYVEANGRIDDEILKQLIKEAPVKDTFDYVYTTAGVTYAQAQYNKFVTGEDLRKTFELYMKDWVGKYAGPKVTSITGISKRDAQKIIQDVISENLGMAEGEMGRILSRELKKRGAEIASWRSRMISRTEVATASNIGQHVGAMEAMNDTGVVMEKTWLATLDNRHRDWHGEMNGVTVMMNEPFKVKNAKGTVEEMNTPCDPNGSGSNVINCRCALLYQVKKT